MGKVIPFKDATMLHLEAQRTLQAWYNQRLTNSQMAEIAKTVLSSVVFDSMLSNITKGQAFAARTITDLRETFEDLAETAPLVELIYEEQPQRKEKPPKPQGANNVCKLFPDSK